MRVICYNAPIETPAMRRTLNTTINRPTNATDSVSLVRDWLYNRRSELAAANIGTNCYGYAYDTIGNRLWSAGNAATNTYAANSLNQYTAISANANPVYDADGNMTSDGTFSYSYDAENRLLVAYPLSPVVGSLAVENRYDHRHRRSRKIVKQYDGADWETKETPMFVWDGNNIVLEKAEFANGTTRMCEYFWGADKSGSEQGAGGVEGLLAVSIDGVFYIPCYYQLTWIGKQSKCNCQDYASALRAKYHELENDPEVKCKCKKGK